MSNISSIGSFAFISMSQVPQSPNQRIQTESRAGVNGTAVWKVGDGGQPFTVTTAVDTASHPAAVSMFQQYEAMIGQGPVSIVYDGISMPYLVTILSVTPRQVSAVVGGVGGLLGTSGGILKASWQLLPWKV